MDIRERVERTLLRQGGGRMRRAAEPSRPFDGHVARDPRGGAALICAGRAGPADAPSAWGRRRVAVVYGRAACADLLIEAGFRVSPVRGGDGAHLRVVLP